MESLYNKNGLIFWTEKEISLREMMKNHFVAELQRTMKSLNRAFEFMQVEAPILTPLTFINPNYTQDDYYTVEGFSLNEEAKPTEANELYLQSKLVLRPETTMGSYQYAKYLMEHTETKTKLPICIWQHGKAFRKEQDQVTKNMRLKEFYQLEFQCIYGLTTMNDYSLTVIPAVKEMISSLIGPCRIEQSDRLPDYSESTTDIVCEKTNMEVCSISIRKDFHNAKVLEVAIGSSNWNRSVCF